MGFNQSTMRLRWRPKKSDSVMWLKQCHVYHPRLGDGKHGIVLLTVFNIPILVGHPLFVEDAIPICSVQKTKATGWWKITVRIAEWPWHPNIVSSWSYIYTGWWLKKNILKNDGVKVNGKDDIPYLKWKIIQMFETTNSYMLYYYIHVF